MEDIVIVRPTLGKRAKYNEYLEDFETKTFYDHIVYTQEVARPSPSVQAPPVVESQESPSDDEDSEQSFEKEVFEPLSVRTFYDQYVSRTYEQCHAEYDAPQRSIAWLEARKYCITASNFGTAIGNNKYASGKTLVQEKLWNTFQGNEFTMYGTFHEPDASKTFQELLAYDLYPTLEHLYAKKYGKASNIPLKWALLESGLIKSHECPWIAVSPDGILFVIGSEGPLYTIVEYKCPARMRHSQAHPYASYKHNIPEYYFDQMQGIMGYMNEYTYLYNYIRKGLSVSWQPLAVNVHHDYAFFVVWQPHQVHVTLVPFQQNYYSQILKEGLHDWYFRTYLPMAVLKHNQLLVPNTLQVSAPVFVNEEDESKIK